MGSSPNIPPPADPPRTRRTPLRLDQLRSRPSLINSAVGRPSFVSAGRLREINSPAPNELTRQ